MTVVALRPDLQDVVDQLDAVDRAAERLVSGLSEAQFFWQPGGGTSWSIAQCLEHLAVTNALYGAAIGDAIAAAKARGLQGGGPIALTWFGRRFVQSLEPPVKARFRAPAKVAPPSPRGRGEIMRAFAEAHARVRDSARAAADIDVNRATFRNPFFGLARVRVGTGLLVIPAHDRRHLWQAENVTRAAGFPSAS